jgi:plastocyanin
MRPRARPAPSAPLFAATFEALRRACVPVLAVLLTCLGLLAAAVPAVSANLSLQAVNADGRPLRGAVVQVYALDAPAHHPVPEHAVMDQVDRTFAPDLLIIPVGSTIVFPNSDSVAHQIYSFSPAKRFQLPLYHGQPYPPTQFDQPGIITLGCNIHDQMLAYVVVTEAAYFGRTDEQGHWSADVAPGHYRLTLWHPRLRDSLAMLEQQVVVTDAGPATINVRLKKPLQPAPLTDRPYSWEY